MRTRVSRGYGLEFKCLILEQFSCKIRQNFRRHYDYWKENLTKYSGKIVKKQAFGLVSTLLGNNCEFFANMLQ